MERETALWGHRPDSHIAHLIDRTLSLVDGRYGSSQTNIAIIDLTPLGVYLVSESIVRGIEDEA